MHIRDAFGANSGGPKANPHTAVFRKQASADFEIQRLSALIPSLHGEAGPPLLSDEQQA